MDIQGSAYFAIHPHYRLPGRLRTMPAAVLLAEAAADYVVNSGELVNEPLVLKGVVPLVVTTKGEPTIINVKELMLFFADAPRSRVHPHQEIMICEIGDDYPIEQVKALSFICEASATKAKRQQELMVQQLVDDKDLLSEVRHVLGLPVRAGKITAPDIARIFSLKGGTAHNRLHAVIGNLEEESETEREGRDEVAQRQGGSTNKEGNPLSEYSSIVLQVLSSLPEEEKVGDVKSTIDRIKASKEPDEMPIDEERLKGFVNNCFSEAIKTQIANEVAAAKTGGDPFK